MPGIVDVHSHFFPRWYLERLKGRSVPAMVMEANGEERIVLAEHEVESSGRPLGEGFWDLEKKLVGYEADVVTPLQASSSTAARSGSVAPPNPSGSRCRRRRA